MAKIHVTPYNDCRCLSCDNICNYKIELGTVVIHICESCWDRIDEKIDAFEFSKNAYVDTF